MICVISKYDAIDLLIIGWSSLWNRMKLSFFHFFISQGPKAVGDDVALEQKKELDQLVKAQEKGVRISTILIL